MRGGSVSSAGAVRIAGAETGWKYVSASLVCHLLIDLTQEVYFVAQPLVVEYSLLYSIHRLLNDGGWSERNASEFGYSCSGLDRRQVDIFK